MVTTFDPDTGKRRRRKQTAQTRQDAAELLKAMLAEKDETGAVTRKDYTVAHAVADLLAHPPSTWKSDITAEINRQHAARLTDALGPVLVSRLTVAQIEDHLRTEITRARRPLSASTVRDELFLLRRDPTRGKAGAGHPQRRPAGRHASRCVQAPFPGDDDRAG